MMKKILLLILLTPLITFAHPHVYADIDLNLKVQNNQLTEIEISWNYDDMTSQILLMDYDKNRDGKFSKKESMFFKNQVFDTLKPYEYYTHVKIDGKKVPVDHIMNNFFLSFKNNKFIVNYRVILKDVPQKKNIDIGFWDKEFYSSFDLSSKTIKFSGKKLKYSIEEVEDDIFMGVVLKVKL
jgi:ABC-type uncharacterized transport system substrate-binding protein